MPPVSPRGMERMATHHAAGSHLAESSAPPRGAGPPTQAVTIGLASVLLGLALCRLGGASRAWFLLCVAIFVVETGAVQACSADGFW